MKKAAILIRNGCVVDPSRDIQAVGTIAIADGHIVDAAEYTGAEQEVDASGCLVCPGLIDFHVHVSTIVSDMATDPMMISFPNGVTTLVDAGSTGTANYEVFRASSILVPVRIKAMLHVCPEGNITAQHHENQDPAFWDKKRIYRFMDKYADQIIGLKIRMDCRVLDNLGIDPLVRAIELAEKIGCPVICHTTNPPVPMNKLIEYFRPGDVFTHIYHGTAPTILDENGKLIDGIIQAQKRGVLLDASNGRMNFSNRVAQVAIKAGLLPDIISTDLTASSAFVDNKNVVSLPFLMSKYLALGLPLKEVIRRVTEIPARTLHMLPEIGTLATGACADVTILRLLERSQQFIDISGDCFEGNKLLKPEMTIREGVTVYRQIDF
jgi:predicted amidohydrolase